MRFTILIVTLFFLGFSANADEQFAPQIVTCTNKDAKIVVELAYWGNFDGGQAEANRQNRSIISITTFKKVQSQYIPKDWILSDDNPRLRIKSSNMQNIEEGHWEITGEIDGLYTRFLKDNKFKLEIYSENKGGSGSFAKKTYEKCVADYTTLN